MAGEVVPIPDLKFAPLIDRRAAAGFEGAYHPARIARFPEAIGIYRDLGTIDERSRQLSNIAQRGSNTRLWYRMRIYQFSIHGSDGVAQEDTGRMALTDDNAARAFAKAMIRDILREGAHQYQGWTMAVAQGARDVCTIAFSQ